MKCYKILPVLYAGILLAFSQILIGCPNKSVVEDSLFTNKNALKFFVLGDWGRNGEYKQKEIAVQMNRSAASINPSFIVSAGDNFYSNGIASTDDPQWWSSFENVYSGANLFVDWFIVLGNHDYHGNTQAEIDYSKKSRRWRMPARYYSIERKIKGTEKKALFVFLDTNQFEKSYYSKPEQYNDLVEQNPEKQIAWMDSVLANSKADWKFVVGHHHVYTGGLRKDNVSETGALLEPYLNKYKVDIYFCGHEHDLQYLKPEGTTHYIVSGAGSQLRETGYISITKFAASRNGFCSVAVCGRELFFQFIDYRGKVIYQNSIRK